MPSRRARQWRAPRILVGGHPGEPAEPLTLEVFLDLQIGRETSRVTWTVRLAIAVTIVLAACTAHPASAGKDRVKKARETALPILKAKFAEQGISYPARRLFLRAFKREGLLEMWASNHKNQPFKKVDTYSICESSGALGPKRQEGDRQVPEGVYTINLFNPRSAFHLSMRVSYPNASDRIRGKRGDLGGAIMVHGNCVTIGCLPIQDGPIEEVFVATQASNRYGKVPIHIFPTRMTAANYNAIARQNPKQAVFWGELQPIYHAFELTHQLPKVRIHPKTGAYITSPIAGGGHR